MNYFKTDILKKEFKNSVLKNFLLQKISVKKFFGVEKKNETKERKKTFDIKVYHKSEKNRSHVVMKTIEVCTKIQCISRRRKHTFYKKI